MSRPLRFAHSAQGELCVAGSAYATTPDLPVRRIPLSGGRVGISAIDLLEYHEKELNDESATPAAKALHRERSAVLQNALRQDSPNGGV